MLLECIQQGRGKAEVPLHKLRSLLGSVHTRQIKHEVDLLTPLIQLFSCRVDVILIDLVNLQAWSCPVLPVLDVIQCIAEVLSHEPL